MDWFKVYSNIKGHQKRYRLEEALGVDCGLHYLLLFWCYVCEYAPDGNISRITPKELARACEWRGDPETLWVAFETAGFVDTNENGRIVHDWAETHKRFIEENSRRRDPRVTQGSPKGNPRATQVRREEKRREEKDIASSPPDTFNPIGDLIQSLTDAGAIVATREPKLVGMVNGFGKKYGKALFKATVKEYLSDEFLKSQGLSIGGFVNQFSKLASRAKSNMPKPKPPISEAERERAIKLHAAYQKDLAEAEERLARNT